MPLAWIESVENGIWCCQYHGVRIDKRKGNEFPADTLFMWKALAEARVQMQMNGTASPLGWVESIALQESSLYSEPPKAILGRLTLLHGESGAGLSMLIEGIAGLSDMRVAQRHVLNSVKKRDERHHQVVTTAALTYSTITEHNVEVRIHFRDGIVSRLRNGVTILTRPPDLQVVFCPDELRVYRESGEDDCDYLMRLLNVDKGTLLGLCASLREKSLVKGECVFEQDELVDDETGLMHLREHEDGSPWISLHFRKEDEDFFVSYGGLARSEWLRLTISLFVAVAREHATHGLTLFILEGEGLNFDERNFQRLLTFLETESFQSIVAMPPSRLKGIVKTHEEDAEKALEDKDFLRNWKLAIINGKKRRNR